LLSAFFDDKRLNKEINLDEALAYGAAVQGAIVQSYQEEQGQNRLKIFYC
jgi:molecular chaperone DnaK (HSP70)